MIEDLEKDQGAIKHPDEPLLDADLYLKVSQAAKLQEVKLIASEYQVKPEAFRAAQDLDNLDLRYSGHCGSLSYDAEDGVCVAHFNWEAQIKLGRKACLKLKSEYLLIYSIMADCDERHVAFFINKVGRFATYPYFRSHFSHHTSETGIFLPPLPTLRERVD